MKAEVKQKATRGNGCNRRCSSCRKTAALEPLGRSRELTNSPNNSGEASLLHSPQPRSFFQLTKEVAGGEVPPFYEIFRPSPQKPAGTVTKLVPSCIPWRARRRSLSLSLFSAPHAYTRTHSEPLSNAHAHTQARRPTHVDRFVGSTSSVLFWTLRAPLKQCL